METLRPRPMPSHLPMMPSTLRTPRTPSPLTLEVPQTPREALKHKLMTALLKNLEWFVVYSEALATYKEHGGLEPMYDMERYNEVEDSVDKLLSRDPSGGRPAGILLPPTPSEKRKNKLMAEILGTMPWFIAYRDNLSAHKERGVPEPTQYADLYDKVEERVDEILSRDDTYGEGESAPSTPSTPSSTHSFDGDVSWSELRTTRHAILKNTVMMALLNEMPWYVEYRYALERHRASGTSSPERDEPRFEAVEKRVDTLIREVIDTTYTR